MSWNKVQWLKEKIAPHLELVSGIKKDGEKISHGKLWSLKKEIFIYEYIKPYVSIIRGNKSYFRRWYYFDPFCGSGLFEIEVSGQKVKFPGSPLLAFSRNQKFPFTGYYLADANRKNLDTLKNRMKVLFPENKLDFYYREFSKSVSFFKTLDDESDAVLAIIDPPGFTQIPWEDIVQVLRFPAVDAFITIISSGIQRNIEQKDSYDSLTSFFGNEDWVSLEHSENIIDEYISRIKSLTGKHVERIPIDMQNQKIYDLLYVSRNRNAIKIMDDIAHKLNQISLNDLVSVVSETSSDVKTLFDYSE